MAAELVLILAAMSPIIELRGAIPLGLAMGMPPANVILLSFLANSAVFFPIFFGLGLFYNRFFSRFAWARRIIERVHKKGAPYVEKYGMIGLAIFVGVPLPFTGAWTGTAVAWLLGLDWKKSFLSITLGVAIATAIVGAISLGVIAGIGLL